jgi:predicted Fe-S protein YdhL (DUF1289 family)
VRATHCQAKSAAYVAEAFESHEAMAAVSSPCVKVCRIDPASGLCIGCRRTLTEIAQWPTLPEDERARIMRALPQRSLPAASAPAATAP